MQTQAYQATCEVVFSYCSDLSCGPDNFDDVIIKLARACFMETTQAGSPQNLGLTVLDLGEELTGTSNPSLYCIWLSKTAVPSIFSISCASKHLKRHLLLGQSPVMTIFNDLGRGNGDVEASSYLIVMKKVDLEKMRCVPVNFTSLQKKAMVKRVGEWEKRAVQGSIMSRTNSAEA